MSDPQEKNSNATSLNNKKQHNPEKPENTASVPSLKTYRNEANSANYERVKDKDSLNQASLKMEEYLKLLLSLLALLPVPLQNETK